MTATAYRVVAPPKFAGLQEFDCQLCGYESLVRPVFLAGPAGVIAAGAGCAAVALYGRCDAAAQHRVRLEFDAAAHQARVAEQLAAERAARYASALADFEADRAGYSPALESCRSTYWSFVRGDWNGEHRMTFPAFLASVAAAGELPS